MELPSAIALIFISVGVLNIVLSILLLFFEELTVLFTSQLNLEYTDFATIAVISILIGMATKYTVKARRQDLIDNNLPNLLRDISEAGISGITILRAIELSSERNYGPLTKELKKLSAQLKWKIPLSEALRRFGDTCGTLFSKKVALLIDVANKSGGNVQENIEIVTQFAQEFQSQQQKRKSELKPHLVVVYISFFIFIALGSIMITQFFNIDPVATELPTNLNVDTNLFRPDLDFSGLFYRISIVEGFFSGLVAGKLSAGTIQAGFMHAAILCVISFITFNFLV